MKRKLLIGLLLFTLTQPADSQNLSLGFTFQYLVLKQVKVDANIVYGTNSYSVYEVKDNRWKLFSAGQSIVVGTVAQLNYKKFYAAIEPSFDLNTYQYKLDYPLSATKNEELNFQILFMQMDIPVYVGLQIQSSKLVRYSVFGGMIFVQPFKIENDFRSWDQDNREYLTYNAYDLQNVLYNGKPYMNALVGVGFHVASLVKLDLRYSHRIGSPGQYDTTFNTVGAALTYYLPLSLLKRRIYYED